MALKAQTAGYFDEWPRRSGSEWRPLEGRLYEQLRKECNSSKAQLRHVSEEVAQQVEKDGSKWSLALCQRISMR